MNKIDLDEVAKKYTSEQQIWQPNDKWHSHNFRKIHNFLKRMSLRENYSNKSILNAGSGGQNYGLSEDNMHHFDLVDVNIKLKKNFLVGNIETLPYPDNSFEVIICVGEVINYSDAFKSLSEFSRVLKTGGELILEYESSKSLELIFTKEFNASSVIVETFFQGKAEKLWYYSENYVNNILKNYGFKILKTKRFHILSILVYRLTKSSNFSSHFTWLDWVAQYIPGVRGCSSNVIVHAKKIT